MYGYINGKVTEIDNSYIIVDNQGIGYIIYVGNPFKFTLNQEIKVYVHEDVNRDGEHTLYGFLNKEEKDLFMKLISVSGVGCKMAMPMLALGTPSGIADAIERENILYLKKFPKIGDKVARQMILDLKGKLTTNPDASKESNYEDLIEVLLGLGYKMPEIKKVIPNVNPSDKVEDQVKSALKLMLKWGYYGRWKSRN